MRPISAEEARANIVAAYTKQHAEAVSVLSSAFERARGSKTDDKPEAKQASKSTLADLLLESAQGRE